MYRIVNKKLVCGAFLYGLCSLVFPSGAFSMESVYDDVWISTIEMPAQRLTLPPDHSFFEFDDKEDFADDSGSATYHEFQNKIDLNRTTDLQILEDQLLRTAFRLATPPVMAALKKEIDEERILQIKHSSADRNKGAVRIAAIYYDLLERDQSIRLSAFARLKSSESSIVSLLQLKTYKKNSELLTEESCWGSRVECHTFEDSVGLNITLEEQLLRLAFPLATPRIRALLEKEIDEERILQVKKSSTAVDKAVIRIFSMYRDSIGKDQRISLSSLNSQNIERCVPTSLEHGHIAALLPPRFEYATIKSSLMRRFNHLYTEEMQRTQSIEGSAAPQAASRAPVEEERAEESSTVILNFGLDGLYSEVENVMDIFVPEDGTYTVTDLNPGNSLRVHVLQHKSEKFPSDWSGPQIATLTNGQSVDLQKGEYFFVQEDYQTTLTLIKH